MHKIFFLCKKSKFFFVLIETQLLDAFNGAYDLPVELNRFKYAQNRNFLHMRCVKFLHYFIFPGFCLKNNYVVP